MGEIVRKTDDQPGGIPNDHKKSQRKTGMRESDTRRESREIPEKRNQQGKIEKSRPSIIQELAIARSSS
jgi:hypothetical protein